MAKETLKVYQIGLHGVGRYGFERLVELSKNFSHIDVELVAVYDRDYEKLEMAESFADVNSIEIDTFQSINDLYEQASHEEDKVMIYDAGTVDSRSEHIFRSMRNNFFHLAEKPPSMTREQHLQEKKLAEDSELMWKVDFIERENPVMRKALEMVEGKNIERIKIFRQSSVGAEKIMDPEINLNVKGGDILDKMINEVFCLDFVEKAENGSLELDIQNANTEYYLPEDLGSENLMSVHGSRTEKLEDAASAQTEAEFKAGDIEIELNSSWLGLTRDCMVQAQEISKKTGNQVFKRRFSKMGEKAYMNEEASFFVIEGEVNLVGDLMNRKLFDLDTGEQIETDNYLHDQLYRVLENAVKVAAGESEKDISEKETDIFMNALFDVKENLSGQSVLKEASKGSEKLKTLIIEDKKVKEPEEKESVAG